MESLIENWNQRPSSEKIILGAVAALMVITLFYLLVVEPINGWREQEQRKLSANQRTLPQVEDLVSRYKQRSSVVGNTTKGLAGLIDSSLQKNSLSMQGFQPGKNNDARLRLRNVAYEPLTQWLYDLEYKHYISIEELAINQAKTQGLLLVNIRVKKN